MKHGVAFRKLSRPTAHRMLMLRNMVTSLLEHEQIKTTLPKAREAARLAEKVITMGKKGDRVSYTRAGAFILKPELLPKLFGSLAERYASRPGGYTRIHKYGHRPGDNAPVAILELVDNPRDLRYNITARAVGWEVLKDRLRSSTPLSIINKGIGNVHQVIEQERRVQDHNGVLRPKTRWNLQKILRFRDGTAALDLSHKVMRYVDQLLATPLTVTQKFGGRDSKAGQRTLGETRSAMQLAHGALGHAQVTNRINFLSRQRVLGLKNKS